MASKSRFYTETQNSKGSIVKTSNNPQYAQAVLGITPIRGVDEDFIGEEILLRCTKDKNGDIVLGISPKSVVSKLKVVLNYGGDHNILGIVDPLSRKVEINAENLVNR